MIFEIRIILIPKPEKKVPENKTIDEYPSLI